MVVRGVVFEIKDFKNPPLLGRGGYRMGYLSIQIRKPWKTEGIQIPVKTFPNPNQRLNSPQNKYHDKSSR